MAEVLPEFIANLPGEVASLRKLLDEENLAALQEAVHQLKGAGGSYGFQGISDLAAIAEHSIRAGASTEMIKSQVVSLVAFIESVRGFSAAWRFQVIDKKKILLVDNSKIMHAAVKARLVADGFEFHSAYGGEEGLLLAATLLPDVILLDVEMPTPNGFEVCRRLKGNQALSNIPVIFLTGVITIEEKVKGLNLGAIDYVTKPFDAAELQARIKASLRNKELLDLLSKKAMIDGLTGVWNRSYLDQRLIEELAFAKRHENPIACIILDVDHFKSINDKHGHGFGDLVLKGIANVLQQLSRDEDICCRYGGEEFSILVRSTDGAAAMLFAERLRKGVEEAVFKSGPLSTSVTASFGIAELGTGGDDILNHADKALYESKNSGRNRVTLFVPELITKAA
jgi:two-component system cell cycle response regulator